MVLSLFLIVDETVLTGFFEFAVGRTAVEAEVVSLLDGVLADEDVVDEGATRFADVDEVTVGLLTALETGAMVARRSAAKEVVLEMGVRVTEDGARLPLLAAPARGILAFVVELTEGCDR